MKAKRTKFVSESGVTILETMIAAVVLLVGIVGVMGLMTVAVTMSEGAGETFTRTTEYSQDKMEQLIGLQFTDTTTDTTNGAGTALGLTAGGSTTSAQSGYADYLDSTGKPLSSATNAFYTRMWSISQSSPGSSTMDVITVVTTGLTQGGGGAKPSSTLVCYKSK